jgi:DNA mismatch repair protein MutL
MGLIRVLPDILASQVAAGEVVERPASVVKELVENSIDAGAREVRVDVDRGGTALIRVADDGSGMTRDDALLSLERHATSKLREAGDLAAIRTLGFRGEAVPSIASVSRFRMVTRRPEDVAGTEILVEGGKVRDVREAGCAPGTTIEARALFFNIPARRKFLRAESTESAHIEHQLRLHALAAPQVRFRLRRDEREIFDLPAVSRPLDRVRQILGAEIGRELIALPLTHGPGVAVEGYVLPPSHARKGRRHQNVFLNGRPVEDPVISRALAEGFRGSLADGLYPAAWIWIEMEPALVDVNVHPAKREVRFHRPHDLRETITTAVATGLRPPSRPAEPAATAAPTFTTAASSPSRSGEPIHSPFTATPLPPRPLPLQSSIELNLPATTPDTPASATPAFRIIGMLLHRYILLESDEGLVFLDPRAATERILHDEIMRGMEHGLETQGLLVPVLLELDPRDLDLALQGRAEMQDAGIEVEAFGGNTLRICTLPACIGIDDPREFLGALMDELLHGSAPGKRFAHERMARLLARRASLRVQPSLAETPKLLDALFRCELPYCAADGRPTLSEYNLREIHRRMGNL